MTTTFTPRVQLREGSHGDPNRAPRWHKAALGVIEERDANRLWFTPNRAHPALRELPDIHLGLEGEPGTMIAMERAFRDANLTKREWKRSRKEERAAGLKLAA